VANGRTFTNVDEAARYIISLGIEFAGTATPPGPYPIRLLDGTIKTVPNTEALLALASEISASPETDRRYFAPPKKETPKEPFKRSALAQETIDAYAQAGGEGTWTGPNPDTGMYTFTIDTPEGDKIVGDPVTEQGLLQATFHPAAAYSEDYESVEQAIREREAEGWTINRVDDGTFDVKEDKEDADEPFENVTADDLLAMAEASALDKQELATQEAATGDYPRPIGYTGKWPLGSINPLTNEFEPNEEAMLAMWKEYGMEGMEEDVPGEAKLVEQWGMQWIQQPDGRLTQVQSTGLTSSDADKLLEQLGPDHEKVIIPGTDKFSVQLKPRRSWDEQIEDLWATAVRPDGTIDPSVIDRILALDNLRDQIDAERMTPERAFQLAAPIMQNPQHLSEMMSSLLGGTGQQLPQDAFQNLVTNYGGQTLAPTPPVTPTTPAEIATQNALAAELGVVEQPTIPPTPDTPEEEYEAPSMVSPRNGLAAGLGEQPTAPPTTPTSTPASDATGAINQASAAQSTNALAQIIARLNLTPEQWENMPFSQQVAALGMEIAESQTGDSAAYLKNPRQYRTQAGATLNSIYSQLPEQQQLAQSLIAGGPRTTLPSGQVVGPFDPQAAGTGAGMRTAEQENRLQQLLYQQEESGKRGVVTPTMAGQQIRQLGAMSAYRDPALLQGTPNALQASLGYGGQEGAFGGTRFFPVHQGRSARGVFQEKGAREWNEAQQRRFKARPVRRTAFQ
jgi:hypothetical protein